MAGLEENDNSANSFHFPYIPGVFVFWDKKSRKRGREGEGMGVKEGRKLESERRREIKNEVREGRSEKSRKEGQSGRMERGNLETATIMHACHPCRHFVSSECFTKPVDEFQRIGC